jgi:hypothetical protein
MRTANLRLLVILGNKDLPQVGEELFVGLARIVLWGESQFPGPFLVVERQDVLRLRTSAYQPQTRG